MGKAEGDAGAVKGELRQECDCFQVSELQCACAQRERDIEAETGMVSEYKK